jgi:hypothetical protein
LLSNKSLGAGGATIISAWLTRKDNGALSSLDLSFDTLGVGALAFISAALKKRIIEKQLCGYPCLRIRLATPEHTELTRLTEDLKGLLTAKKQHEYLATEWQMAARRSVAVRQVSLSVACCVRDGVCGRPARALPCKSPVAGICRLSCVIRLQPEPGTSVLGLARRAVARVPFVARGR